ncbi:MAG: DUF262 domain-containing protein, partial [Acidobacteriota bacterium]|nr:DUF262 domain-containing protein [Acidobacteriota bacterium]
TTPFKYSISNYGADYVVEVLVKRVSKGDIFIPPFQREYVWSLKDASRFIESLLLGLPVPSVFLSREPESQKLLVIDGSQRLRTLRHFYDGIWPKTKKEFSLIGVQKQFRGKTYKTLADEDRRRLDDSVIHAIILRQDEPSDDYSSIYYVFERLNTGGLLLTPQEIRASIYHGPFSELLKRLSRLDDWNDVYGPSSANMRDQELILRFLALYFSASNYHRPMKDFLNRFMARNRRLKLHSEDEIETVFKESIHLVKDCLGRSAFKPKRALNAAVFDAAMVGIARRLETSKPNCNELRTSYEGLLANEEFLRVSERSTADEENVEKRLRLATEAFAQADEAR